MERARSAPQPPTVQRGAVFVSVVRALRVVGSGRPGFWPLLSRLGAAALFLNPGTRLSGHRRQPRRRGSLADWGRTPSKALQMQKYENVKEVVETIRQFFSSQRRLCGRGGRGRAKALPGSSFSSAPSPGFKSWGLEPPLVRSPGRESSPVPPSPLKAQPGLKGKKNPGLLKDD